MKPITRYERYLAYLGSDEDANGIDSPVTRIEQYLAKIAGQDVPIPEKPILRIEQYLAKIAGEDVAIPEKPLSRVEMYLAAIAGEDIEVPEPITREEWYLAQWAENGSGVLKTVSGAIVHITDALAKPAKKFVASLEPIQSGSGDPAPDNVRPITGHTGANVTRTGKNLGFLTANNVSSHQNDSVTYQSNDVIVESTGNYGRTGFSVPVKAGEKYTVSFKAKRSGQINNIQFSSKVAWSYDYYVISNTTENVFSNFSFTFTAITDLLFVGIYVNISGSTITIEDFQVEVGETATTYEAYTATTIPITFPAEAGTVYGGTLTNEDGEWKLSVEREKYVFTGNETWSFSTSSAGFFYTNAYYPAGYAKSGSAYSENGLRIAFNVANQQLRIYLSNNSFLTQDSNINEYLPSGMGVLIELATPIEYTLTESQALTLLAGGNNIWVDDSDFLELTYYADGTVSTLEALNTLLGGTYQNLGTPDDVSDREALQIILGETT